MVRLKEKWGYSYPRLRTQFQFLYGAIKSHVAAFTIAFCSLFQFLYGAIKSDNLHLHQCQSKIFQFLYGAIKSDPQGNVISA